MAKELQTQNAEQMSALSKVPQQNCVAIVHLKLSNGPLLLLSGMQEVAVL